MPTQPSSLISVNNIPVIKLNESDLELCQALKLGRSEQGFQLIDSANNLALSLKAKQLVNPNLPKETEVPKRAITLESFSALLRDMKAPMSRNVLRHFSYINTLAEINETLLAIQEKINKPNPDSPADAAAALSTLSVHGKSFNKTKAVGTLTEVPPNKKR